MAAYITQVDETNYDEIINNNSLILLDIYAEWWVHAKQYHLLSMTFLLNN